MHAGNAGLLKHAQRHEGKNRKWEGLNPEWRIDKLNSSNVKKSRVSMSGSYSYLLVRHFCRSWARSNAWSRRKRLAFQRRFLSDNSPKFKSFSRAVFECKEFWSPSNFIGWHKESSMNLIGSPLGIMHLIGCPKDMGMVSLNGRTRNDRSCHLCLIYKITS